MLKDEWKRSSTEDPWLQITMYIFLLQKIRLAVNLALPESTLFQSSTSRFEKTGTYYSSC